MIDAQALLVGGALLICIISIFFLWLSHNKTKRRLRKLEGN